MSKIYKVIEEKFEDNWRDRYAKAMEFRDWQTCDYLFDVRQEAKDNFKAGFMACVEWLLPELQAMENSCDSHSANEKSYVNEKLYELCRKLQGDNK